MDSRLTLSCMDDKYIIYSEGAQIKSGVENGGLTLERIKAFDALWPLFHLSITIVIISAIYSPPPPSSS